MDFYFGRQGSKPGQEDFGEIAGELQAPSGLVIIPLRVEGLEHSGEVLLRGTVHQGDETIILFFFSSQLRIGRRVPTPTAAVLHFTPFDRGGDANEHGFGLAAGIDRFEVAKHLHGHIDASRALSDARRQAQIQMVNKVHAVGAFERGRGDAQGLAQAESVRRWPLKKSAFGQVKGRMARQRKQNRGRGRAVGQPQAHAIVVRFILRGLQVVTKGLRRARERRAVGSHDALGEAG